MSLPLRWDQPELPAHAEQPLRSPHRRRRPARIARIFAAITLLTAGSSVLVLAGVGARTAWSNIHAGSDLKLIDPVIDRPQVALSTPSVERRLGFVTVTGTVANAASIAQHNVEAVVELVDPENRTVRMESAMIAFDPLGPKQSAPFRVEIPDDSRAVGYRVRFKKLSGESLD